MDCLLGKRRNRQELCKNDRFFALNICKTKIAFHKKHQGFVGFAYYQPQGDIKTSYALFIFHTEIGWKMKTRSFDRKAVKKVSPESCPIRTRGAKKGNKERKQKWISVFVALTAMW